MTSPGRDPREDVEEGDQPLLSGRASPGEIDTARGYSTITGLVDRPTKSITHKESVYSFALFVPPLSRKKYGHYCTGNVLLAFGLLFFTITTQMSLSQIAGTYITNQSRTFKVSLIRNKHWMSTAITPLDFAADWVKRNAQDLSAKLQEPTDDNGTKASSGECCDKAECTSVMKCCTPTEKRRMVQGHSKSTASFLDSDPLDPMAVPHMPGDLNINRTAGRFSSIFGDDGGIALCRRVKADGELDCTPPSYAYMHYWPELDANGDGVWTVEEATADVSNLGCRLGLPATDFFHSAVRGIIRDAKDTAENSFVIPLIPGSIEKRRAIPKEYFRWFTGMINLCLSFDVSRCGQLIKSGIFDGAIGVQKEAGMPGLRGGIHDLDSALDFCQRMLKPNGICETTLPHTYLLYRARVAEKCGAPSYTVSGKHINPHDPRDAMSIVDVSFSEHGEYVSAQEWKFQVFLGLILFVWYVTLVSEISRILDLWDLLWNIKSAERSTFSLMTPEAREKMRRLAGTVSRDMGDSLITSPRDFEPTSPPVGTESGRVLLSDLSHHERVFCWMTWSMRLFLWWYMANVGTTFLLASFAYDDLLFNAVALAFIFELQEFLYVFLVSDQNKKLLENAKSANYPTSLPVNGWKSVMMSRAFWGLVLIPMFVFTVLYYNLVNNLRPSSEALDCACFQMGPHCSSAQSFTKEWWEKHWQDTLPLAKLRASYLGPR